MNPAAPARRPDGRGADGEPETPPVGSSGLLAPDAPGRAEESAADKSCLLCLLCLVVSVMFVMFANDSVKQPGVCLVPL